MSKEDSNPGGIVSVTWFEDDTTTTTTTTTTTSTEAPTSTTEAPATTTEEQVVEEDEALEEDEDLVPYGAQQGDGNDVGDRDGGQIQEDSHTPSHGVVSVSFFCAGYGPTSSSSSSPPSLPVGDSLQDEGTASDGSQNEEASAASAVDLPEYEGFESLDVQIMYGYDAYVPETTDKATTTLRGDDGGGGGGGGGGWGREGDRSGAQSEGDDEDDGGDSDLNAISEGLDRTILDFLVEELGLEECVRLRRSRRRTEEIHIQRLRGRRRYPTEDNYEPAQQSVAKTSANRMLRLEAGQRRRQLRDTEESQGAQLRQRRGAEGRLVGLAIGGGPDPDRECAPLDADEAPLAAARSSSLSAAASSSSSSCTAMRGYVTASFAADTHPSYVTSEVERIRTLISMGMESGEFANELDQQVERLVFRPDVNNREGGSGEDIALAPNSEGGLTATRGGGLNTSGLVIGIAVASVVAAMLLVARVAFSAVRHRREKREMSLSHQQVGSSNSGDGDGVNGNSSGGVRDEERAGRPEGRSRPRLVDRSLSVRHPERKEKANAADPSNCGKTDEPSAATEETSSYSNGGGDDSLTYVTTTSYTVLSDAAQRDWVKMVPSSVAAKGPGGEDSSSVPSFTVEVQSEGCCEEERRQRRATTAGEAMGEEEEEESTISTLRDGSFGACFSFAGSSLDA